MAITKNWETISDPGTHRMADGIITSPAGQVNSLKEGDTVSGLIDTTLDSDEFVDLVASPRGFLLVHDPFPGKACLIFKKKNSSSL